MIEQVDLRKHTGEPEIRAEEILKRRSHLIGIGFGQEWVDGLFPARPTLYDPVIVDEHISWLEDHHFQDPVKLISSLPAIFGYNQESMEAKLKWLEDHHFQDPVKLISSSPAIFGLASKNIGQRLKLFGRLIRLYSLPFDPVELMENDYYLFSTKPDKIFVLARILRDYQVASSTLEPKLIGKLLRANLEDVLVASNETKENSIYGLLKRIPQVWKRKLPREEKRLIIAEGLQEANKIKQRYFRGYTN